MDECNSSEIDKTNLTDQTKIRLDKITEIENYFHQEINQRKLCSKKLSKYVAAFDYIGKILIVLVQQVVEYLLFRLRVLLELLLEKQVQVLL